MPRSQSAILSLAAALILSGGGLIGWGLNGENGADGPVPRALTAGDGPSSRASSPGRSSPGPSSPGAPAAPTGPSPAQAAKAERAKRVKQLDAALKKVAADAPDFSAAVLDKKTGETYVYRGTATFDTASIVKAQILACILLRAQDADRAPSSSEMALAKPMIRLSDNDATTALFQRLGGRSALSRCNKRLGLTRTVVNSAWGLTRTTAFDQLKLLSEFVDPKGPLDADSRKTAFGLMSTVDEAQDWGVPSIARPGEITTVKNGWDTRTADGGLWVVNTIGRVTSADGEVDVSVAVLSDHNTSEASGRALVQRIAKLTRQYLKY